MSDSMQTDVIDITRRAFELYKEIWDKPKFIAERLDDKWGYTKWQCVIYRGSLLDFDSKYYFYENRKILLKVGDYLVLIWGYVTPTHKDDSSCSIA